MSSPNPKDLIPSYMRSIPTGLNPYASAPSILYAGIPLSSQNVSDDGPEKYTDKERELFKEMMSIMSKFEDIVDVSSEEADALELIEKLMAEPKSIAYTAVQRSVTYKALPCRRIYYLSTIVYLEAIKFKSVLPMELRRTTRFPEYAPQAAESSSTRPTSSVTRPKKKQKHSSVPSKPSVPRQDDFSRIKGRKGMLKTMTEMPLDILFEIFSQLQPIDLLHLSWATKDIRAIVMDNNASFLWKNAFQNIHGQERPPQCPQNISLVRYTKVLYGKHCFFCSSTPANNILWKAKTRICHKCAGKRLINVGTSELDADIVNLCASQYFHKHPKLYNGTYILKDEYQYHERKLAEMEDEISKTEYTEAVTRAKTGPSVLRATRQYYSWISRIQAKRSNESRKTRHDREIAIRNKIREEGYGYEFDALLRRCPGVRVTANLTEKGWKRIKPGIIEILEYSKQEKERGKIRDFLRQRTREVSNILEKHFWTTMGIPFIVPPFAHFIASEPYSELLRSSASDIHQDTNAFVAKVKQLPVSYIDDITSSWKSQADNFLLKLIAGENKEESIQSQSTPSRLDMLSLSLAVTFFKCNWCNDPIRYPRILMHRCLRDVIGGVDEDEDEMQGEVDVSHHSDEEDYDEEEEESDSEEPSVSTQPKKVVESPIDTVWRKRSSWCGSNWNHDEIFVDAEASGFAKAIVQVCGEDPTKTAFSRMREINPRVECVRCRNDTKRRGRLVMTWTMAILHDIETHYQDPPSTAGWKLIVDDGDLAQIKDFETKQKKEAVLTASEFLDAPFKTRPYPVKIN